MHLFVVLLFTSVQTVPPRRSQSRSDVKIEEEETGSGTKLVRMPDTSTPAVRSLLTFLYTFNVDAASSNPKLALELLKAGKKYEIPSLERRMFELLRCMPLASFSVDDAIAMFEFANEAEGFACLLEKSVRVLRR